MPIVVIEVINIEQRLISMKATLDWLLKESAEKNAQAKHKNKQIANPTKKLKKQPIKASNKYSGVEDSNKVSNHNEQSDITKQRRITP